MNKLAANALTALTALTQLTGTPTATEREQLALWSGWGPISKALNRNPDAEWGAVADQLDVLLSEPELNAARDVVDTSFYTSAPVVAAVFDLLAATGFTGGRILEPGCGSGNFMSNAPAGLNVEWTGVEIDPIAARFARAMNPDATIIDQPLQKVTFRSGEFDAVVGNVPFSSTTVFDPAYTSASLHEYFTLRAIDAVRPGGYVIVITSRHMLDAAGGFYGIDGADLISAVRLPSSTFEGTAVVADVLVFRKKDNPDAADLGWEQPYTIESKWGYRGSYTARTATMLPVVTGTAEAEVSAFWAVNPACVAGALTATGYTRAPLKVISGDHAADIAAAVAAATALIIPGTYQVREPEAFADIVLEDGDGRKSGSFHIIDGIVHQVENGHLTVLSRPTAELKALIPLRDAAVELIDLESHPERPDHEIAPARAAALNLYRGYVQKYGPLNRGNLIEGKPDAETGEPTMSWRRPTMGGFRRDPDYVAVLALEHFDQDSGEAEPAPILLRRVGARPPRATDAASADEALAITLGEGGGLNLTRIGSLLGITDLNEVIAELGDSIFRDPATGSYETARDYLSGDVRSKLSLAEAEAVADESYQRNVTALTAVVPDLLGPLDIRVQLGATWITPKDINDFAREVLGGWAQVKFTAPLALWELDNNHPQASSEARIAYGTSRMTPYEILSAALNGKAPTVYDEVWTVDNRNKKVRNQEQTLAAEEKLNDLQDRFAEWVWEDESRAKRLLTEYNRRFNSHVVRRGDGSYLTFPGLDERINLWPHQRDAVDLIVSKERVLLGHPVGAGKTLELVVGAHTLRRLGQANKPLIIVPNHLLEQIAREAQQAYPTGRFLIAAKEDLAGDSRRLFAARCATGEWDAVVMTHQAFTSIGVDPETESRWLETQKAELRWYLQSDADGGSRGSKQIAAAVRKLEERISGLRHNIADRHQITFEQLGIDHISVDEAHYFRRLSIATRAEGFSLGASKRATDLLLKVDTLGERFPGKPILALFTGTPWSNTLAETYVWQKFLQPERLEAAGVAHFDAWAATFVRYETRVEVTPDGSGFRMYRRPSVIQNVPELRLMLADVADLLTADAIGLERPDATWENIVSQPAEEQAAFMANLAVRADEIRTSGSKPQRPNGEGEDNMLLVCNDGRRVALDPQLVGIAETSAKIEDTAQKIAHHYRAGRDRAYGSSTTPGNFQLVLCDIGTPRPGDSQVYGRLRKRLVELGIPADRVRFVHDAATDKARSYLFAQCREGAVSVLIGSTDKVGVGTNIQTRLEVIHHLDAPWRPSDIEQREGRGLRPKNLNEHVFIYRYLTERSFDSFMWQTLERKQRFISQMFIVDGAVREIEDVSEAVLNYAEVKALAAGNPELLRQAELAAEVRRLRTVRSVHTQTVRRMQEEASSGRKDAAGYRDRATQIETVLANLDKTGDLARLFDLAEVAKEGEGWSRGTWRGLTLRAENNSYYGKKKVAGATLNIEHGYQAVGDIRLSGADTRKSPTDIAKIIAAGVDSWIERNQDEPARLRRFADISETRAAESEAAAAGSSFEHADELATAERELSIVEAAIEAEVDQKIAA